MGEVIQFVPRASKQVISDLDRAFAELNQMSVQIFSDLMLSSSLSGGIDSLDSPGLFTDPDSVA